MNENKTEFIGVKVNLAKRKNIEDQAQKENRSMSNLLECCFDQYMKGEKYAKA